MHILKLKQLILAHHHLSVDPATNTNRVTNNNRRSTALDPREGTESPDPRSAKSWSKEHAPMDYQESSMVKGVWNHTQNHVRDGSSVEEMDVPEETSVDSSINCLARQ